MGSPGQFISAASSLSKSFEQGTVGVRGLAQPYLHIYRGYVPIGARGVLDKLGNGQKGPTLFGTKSALYIKFYMNINYVVKTISQPAKVLPHLGGPSKLA